MLQTPLEALLELFKRPHDPDLPSRVRAASSPTVRYLMAITPRSGSSYLCDVLENTKVLGRPGEFLGAGSVRGNQARIAVTPSPDEYVELMLKYSKTPNGVAGMKASWVQYKTFAMAMADPSQLEAFKFVRLTRLDRFAQAVSLYRSSSTKVAHTNIQHDKAKLEALDQLPYDFKKIDNWYRNIESQEQGWEQFFTEHKIVPLDLTYEDITADLRKVVLRIASHVGVPEDLIDTSAPSVFRKISTDVNAEWSQRFTAERKASMGAPPLRR